ncbi:MAG: LysM peptidoglycan-binding domain-containing protein [Firmicutes bacterium]|nr:LysM peptidoglycan-binding domain-containing protein [Bacillota bacterium]
MKKKVFSAFLLAGALAVTPMGGAFLSMVATASSNNTVSAGSSNTLRSSDDVHIELEEQVAVAESGAVVSLQGVTTLSNGDMKLLLAKDVTLVMEYTYAGVDYVVTIPAGAALDDDIRWYGPLYLASLFGNGETVVEDATYTVQAGDTLSKIARKVGMTLNELVAKNSQITDINRIKVGQQINIK